MSNRSPEMAPTIGPSLGGGVAGSGAVSTSGAADLPDVREAIDTPSEVVALDTPQVASRAVQATPEMEQAAYDEAFQSLKDLRYADAAEQFQAFLASYPDSDPGRQCAVLAGRILLRDAQLRYRPGGVRNRWPAIIRTAANPAMACSRSVLPTTNSNNTIRPAQRWSKCSSAIRTARCRGWPRAACAPCAWPAITEALPL